MGMSTHVKGFIPPDEKWEQMKAAYDACKDAGIEPPKPVLDFFNDEEPNENGVEVSIKAAVSESSDDAQEHIDVDITKLPKHVRYIRFTNSW